MLEKDVRMHITIAEQLGLVRFCHHTQPRTTMRKGELVHAERSVADFSGHLVGGKVLAVEAKARRHELRRAEISDKQQEHLRAVSIDGGLALLAVRIYEDDQIATAAIRWHEVPWRVERSGQKLQIEDVRRWAIGRPCFVSPFVAKCPTCGRVEPNAPEEFSRVICVGCACARLARTERT